MMCNMLTTCVGVFVGTDVQSLFSPFACDTLNVNYRLERKFVQRDRCTRTQLIYKLEESESYKWDAQMRSKQDIPSLTRKMLRDLLEKNA